DLLGADRGFVLLADDADPSHPFSARAARDRRKDDPSVQFSRSIAERVLQTGEPIVANDARTDARLGEAQSVHALPPHGAAPRAAPARRAERAPPPSTASRASPSLACALPALWG